MEVQVIRDFEEFKALKDEWNKTLMKSQCNTFYLTFEWLSTWWQYFGEGDELFVILIRDDGKLIGAAPLMIKKTQLGGITVDRKLQFIAHDVSDYMDFMITDKPEKCFSLIFDQIKMRSNLWDWAEFVYIPENSPLLSYWLNQSGLKEVRDISVVIDLTKYQNWEEYFRSLDKKVRDDVKRQENNLKRMGEISLEIFTDYDQINSTLSKFFELHRKRWAEEGFKSQFQDERLKKRYLALAEVLSSSGRVELSCLKVDQVIAALHFGFVYNERYYYYTPAFNPEFKKFSPGKLLLANLIRNSFEKRFKKFDLLRGAEKYKFFWSDNKISLYGISVFKKSMASQMKYFYKKELRFRLARIPFLRYLKRKLSG